MTYAGHYFFEIFLGFGDVGLPKKSAALAAIAYCEWGVWPKILSVIRLSELEEGPRPPVSHRRLRRFLRSHPSR